MAHHPEAEPVDERLARLLEVERRLEARVADAEGRATARVAAARDAAQRGKGARGAPLDEALRSEQAEELDRHEAELARIRQECASRVAHLAALPESFVDTLARRAVAGVVESGGEGTGRS